MILQIVFLILEGWARVFGGDWKEFVGFFHLLSNIYTYTSIMCIQSSQNIVATIYSTYMYPQPPLTHIHTHPPTLKKKWTVFKRWLSSSLLILKKTTGINTKAIYCIIFFFFNILNTPACKYIMWFQTVLFCPSPRQNYFTFMFAKKL